uniref:Uncharacterized protein n=1 Tax=Vitis vinifera TaxID=29760 RepID=F6HUF1_VITVI
MRFGLSSGGQKLRKANLKFEYSSF